MKLANNVIDFPSHSRRPGRERLDQGRLLNKAVEAICAIGEPARLQEISRRLNPSWFSTSEDLTSQLMALLVRHGPGSTASILGFPIFRPVVLQGEPAWAFSREFRTLLRECRCPSRLRPLSRAPSGDQS